MSAFSEYSLLLIISALAGAVSVRLRQPLSIAYTVVGILAGPAVFGLVSAHDQIDLLAQVGIAVLLFLVGLKLDLHHVRHIGPVALATDLDSNLAFLNALKEHRFCGEVAFVARDDADYLVLKQAGAPTVLYPMRDAVDYTVEHFVTLIRPEEEPA